MHPISIKLTATNSVVFEDSGNRQQVYKDYDLIEVKGAQAYIRIQDRDNDNRYLDIQLDELTTINVNGSVSTYVPVTAYEKRTELGRYQAFVKVIVDKLSNEVFTGSIKVSGGGGSTVVNILNSSDAIVSTVDASVPDTVKMMDASLTGAKVGTQYRITAPASAVLKPYPIRVSRPVSASVYTNDFADNYANGVFDFWLNTGDVKLMQIGANDFVLNAATPNPFAALDRYTSTDGSGPTTANSAVFSTFGAGQTYVVCDWLNRLMWYVANIGNKNFADTMTEVTTQNTAVLKGYTGWFVPCIELFLASGYTDHSANYYASPNMFQRGAVSGYSEGVIWMSRVAELSPANGMSFYSAYDWRRRGLTSAGQSAYLCRTITDADITAMGGTP